MKKRIRIFKDKLLRHLEQKYSSRPKGYCQAPLSHIFMLNNLASKSPDALYAFVSSDTESLFWKIKNKYHKSLWAHVGLAFFQADQLWACHFREGQIVEEHLLCVMNRSDNFSLIKLPVEGSGVQYVRQRVDSLKSKKPDWKSLGLSPENTGTIEKHFKKCSVRAPEFVETVLSGIHTKIHRSRPEISADDIYASGEVVYQHLHKTRAG